MIVNYGTYRSELHREFDSLCVEFSGDVFRCAYCPCRKMNCCSMPFREVTPDDLKEGINALKSELRKGVTE